MTNWVIKDLENGLYIPANGKDFFCVISLTDKDGISQYTKNAIFDYDMNAFVLIEDGVIVAVEQVTAYFAYTPFKLGFRDMNAGVEPIQKGGIINTTLIKAAQIESEPIPIVGHGHGLVDGKFTEHGNTSRIFNLEATSANFEGFGKSVPVRIIQNGKYSIILGDRFYVGEAVGYDLSESFRQNLSNMSLGELLHGVERFLSAPRIKELDLEGKNVDILLHRGKFDFIVEGNVIKTCLTMREAENYVLGK